MVTYLKVLIYIQDASYIGLSVAGHPGHLCRFSVPFLHPPGSIRQAWSIRQQAYWDGEEAVGRGRVVAER